MSGQRPGLSPLAMASALLRHRALAWQLARREVAARYRGSVLGLAWSFVTPVLLLAVYTFVFSVVFQARWGEAGGDRISFAAFLFAGMLVHGLFADVLVRAPGLVLANPSYVKKVVFPLEILPWVGLMAAGLHLLAGFAVLLVFQLAVGAGLPATSAWLPLLLLGLVPWALAIGWLLSALGVYLRDLGQVAGLLAVLLMFLAPVFYPVRAVPEAMRAWMYANPLTLPIEQVRAVLLLGDAPDLAALALHAALGALAAWLAFAFFQSLRRGFADVV